MQMKAMIAVNTRYSILGCPAEQIKIIHDKPVTGGKGSCAIFKSPRDRMKSKIHLLPFGTFYVARFKFL